MSGKAVSHHELLPHLFRLEYSKMTAVIPEKKTLTKEIERLRKKKNGN